ncbi:hypothetical protein GS504_08085 [Rhodococcus hoagii]|nr:hypothetical protein [Prescottella equi]NKR39666.1 hypothetical protein [Prescottella equi]NKR60901.1 hypothetical protein [Prescottella equi]NKR72487.1 hypothetical protein [Prescottella equi]NKR91058.1 hypothetical protein [Prescottella equi]
MSGNATGAPLVRAGAPDGCSVADKSGGAGPIRNDIAIVTPPGRAPAFLALLAKISTLQHETMSWSATPPRPGSGCSRSAEVEKRRKFRVLGKGSELCLCQSNSSDGGVVLARQARPARCRIIGREGNVYACIQQRW